MKMCARMLLGTVALPAPFAAHAEYEGAVFGVENYGGGELCCPGCDNLSYPNDAATGVRDALMSIGYDQVKLNMNAAVDGRDWTDSHLFPSWGQDYVDPYGTDFADVTFYMGHGLHICDNTNGYYSEITMGDRNNGSQTCDPRTDRHMSFGQGGSGEEANVLLVAACGSMHYCVWQHHGYDALFHGDFNTYNGFHGLAYEYSGLQGDLEDYVIGAKYNGIGDDWVDSLTKRTGLFGLFGDRQCATSMITGSSSSARNNQYSNGGFRDFKDTGSQTGSTYYFICGCDPKDGAKLPDC